MINIEEIYTVQYHHYLQNCNACHLNIPLFRTSHNVTEKSFNEIFIFCFAFFIFIFCGCCVCGSVVWCAVGVLVCGVVWGVVCRCVVKSVKPFR
jgi:hypothetical protein